MFLSTITVDLMDTTTLRFYVDYLSNIYFYYSTQIGIRSADAALMRTCGLCTGPLTRLRSYHHWNRMLLVIICNLALWC
jgi:hypothetical protein